MRKTAKIPVVSKEVLIPFILVTSLFALWGFANAVTDPMVQAFKKVLELSNSQAAWVQMAFYGGYFCMALPAAMFMRKYSYKVGILIGLGLYAVGALLFYPAAITEQFWFFLGLFLCLFRLLPLLLLPEQLQFFLGLFLCPLLLLPEQLQFFLGLFLCLLLLLLP